MAFYTPQGVLVNLHPSQGCSNQFTPLSGCSIQFAPSQVYFFKRVLDIITQHDLIVSKWVF